jgi:hypothetical protein
MSEIFRTTEFISLTDAMSSTNEKSVNALGRKLLQMCYNTGLTVANGRLGNDMEERFTFCMKIKLT